MRSIRSDDDQRLYRCASATARYRHQPSNDKLHRKTTAGEARRRRSPGNASAIGFRKRTNGDKVLIAERTDIIGTQREECLGATRSSHELDFDSIGRMQLYDCSEVTTPKPRLRDVESEGNRFE